MSGQDCIFCKIARNEAPRDLVTEWDDAVAIRPLDPVTNGHTLVIPKVHVANYTDDPDVTAATMRRAAQLAPHIDRESNLITSCGPLATQTVMHLHVHIVPRRRDDGLVLPWTDQSSLLAAARREAADEILAVVVPPGWPSVYRNGFADGLNKAESIVRDCIAGGAL